MSVYEIDQTQLINNNVLEIRNVIMDLTLNKFVSATLIKPWRYIKLKY